MIGQVTFAICLILLGSFIATQNTSSKIAWPLIVIGAVLMVRCWL